MDKTKEQFGNFNQKLQGYMKDPKIVKRLKGAGIIIVSIGAAALGGPPLFKAIWERTGKTATDQEVQDALNGNGTDPYKDMYQKRMDAGQQQDQNEAAQKFVDENKSKYTSQRAFYDAALGAGDKNFANDVIAIVKKDTPELPREPNKSEGKESSSYLNKTPYSGS